MGARVQLLNTGAESCLSIPCSAGFMIRNGLR